MRANRAYELVVSRAGRAPGLLADPDRPDHVEVVDIASAEVVLYWPTVPAVTGRLARALRADLASLEGDAFLAKWQAYDGGHWPVPSAP